MMGRELRRVPEGWEHPKADMPWGHAYKPLYDESFEEAMTEWIAEGQRWLRGEAKYQREDDPRTWAGYVGFNGLPSGPEYYRPDWPTESATHYQVYETVSEGTPVSPVFATEAEVVDWWVNVGDSFNGRLSREAAEAWVGAGSSPTMIATQTLGLVGGAHIYDLETKR